MGDFNNDDSCPAYMFTWQLNLICMFSEDQIRLYGEKEHFDQDTIDFILNSPIHKDLSAISISIVVTNVLLLGYIAYLWRCARQLKHKIITPNPNALHDETYCSLTLDILRCSQYLLISIVFILL